MIDGLRIFPRILACAYLAGCVSVPNTPAPAPPELPSAEIEASSPPAPDLAPPTPAPSGPLPGTTTADRIFQLQDWSALPDWPIENPVEALSAFRLSCASLRSREEWKAVCAAAVAHPPGDAAAARRFFESGFVPYRVLTREGAGEGLITGYYEPLLRGSRTPDRLHRFALYGVPEDLLVVDLAELHPDLKGVRLRGRIEGRKVVPYFSRAQIERGDAPLRGKEILWVDDAVELFFLQIQGSGRVVLPDGEVARVGFAEHNGHPYRSIGRVLIDRGEISADKASMQGIKQWAKQHPERLPALLQENPAYVFFREMPATEPGPIGAQGVALTPGRSIAVDPSAVPLGAPVFLATTWPLSNRPLNRLMIAQDSGSAIKGAVRADFFWGFGEEAGQLAGRMRQRGRLWMLYPRGFAPPG